MSLIFTAIRPSISTARMAVSLSSRVIKVLNSTFCIVTVTPSSERPARHGNLSLKPIYYPGDGNYSRRIIKYILVLSTSQAIFALNEYIFIRMGKTLRRNEGAQKGGRL